MVKNNSDSAATEISGGFLIAGIGASAGGIQALKEFFQHVPTDSGIAYVVILHLSPDHDSKLAHVLQIVSAIPVLQVTEKTKIEPDHIYVVPPNQHLIIQDGFIAPTLNVHIQDRRAPVDIFFRNLADTHGSRAVCVVLSGTGANGSMGLKRIKEMGGVAYVQSPREAEFNEMPRNSIATELVDEVLPVAEIPAKIIAYRNSVGTVQISIEPEKRPETDQQALREIFTQLRVRTGHDFTNYKRPTLLRRIERRINIRNLPDLPSYVHFLSQNPDEVNALLKDLLISVTNFFRDVKPFQQIEQDVLTSIFQDKNSNDQIRIWVAGCATGEEAYSVAILIAEKMVSIIDAPKVQIFATDIDEGAIAVAREGYYTINDAADVSPERLRRFFSQEGEGYRIKREIREMILFASHNFLKDPPFSRLNLITCRNVLIYLNATAQERIMETFHFALNPGGFLFLGTSESVDGASDLYAAYNRENHIYQAREVGTRSFPVPESVPRFEFLKTEQFQKPDEKEVRLPNRMSFGELHQKLLEQYAPPSVVVNEEYEIVHMSEKAGSYLEFIGGEPTQNILKLIKPEIRLELRSAIYQAVQHKTPVEARNIKVSVNAESQLLNIKVRPVLNDGDTSKGFILIIFEQKDDGGDEATVMLSSDEPVAKQLEEELNRIKSQLRNSIEQHEYQAEELKATNEELQAMNEELRSSAEELETSKEELQSINEELRTVNQELKVKIEETSVTTNNLQNLINSADVGTIFLDRSFSIRMFTPAVLEVFNLKSSDLGRPITDITNKLHYKELLQDAETVLEKLTSVEREVDTTDSRTFVMRLLPYRTSDDRISGVVITFFDITKRKQTEIALHRSEQYRRLLIESAKDYAIFTLDTERLVVSWNAGAETMMGYSETEIIGKAADIIFTPEDLQDAAPAKEAEKAMMEGRAENERWHMRKDGSRFWGSGSVSPLKDGRGELIGFVKIMRDLTQQRTLEQTKFFLASIVETTNDSIVTIDFERNITSWNKSAEHLYGYSAAEAIGKSLHMLTLPKDLLEIISNVDKVVHNREVAVFDTVRVNKGGQYLDLEIVLSPVLNTIGEVIGVSTVARDVSERKRREEHLAFLAGIDLDFAPLLSVTDIFRQVGMQLGNFFHLSRCEFSFVNEQADEIEVIHEWRENENLPGVLGRHRISDNLTDAGRQHYKAGKLSIINDVKDSPFVKGSPDRFLQLGLGSIVDVPHMQNGRWTFLLTVGRAAASKWRKDEVELIREVASRVWIRIERAKAEEALRISEDRFRTLTDAIPQVVWANDEKGEANYFNQRWYEYSGLTYEQSFGLGWEAIVHPDDARASREKWQASLAQGKIFDTEYRLKNADGNYRWHIGRNIPLKDNTGNITSWFGTATDIENLKKADALVRQTSERLQLALEAGHLGSYEYDFTSGKIISTAQHKKNFGYAENEELSFEELKALIIPEDRDYAASELTKAIQEKTIYSIEYRIKLKGENIRWIKSTGRITYDYEGKPEKLVGITLDITEQKLFTEELKKQVNQRTLELQRSNEDLRQFAHVASHDLKEPVRKIKTFNNRIIDEFSDVIPDKVKTYLEKIEVATNRMYTMIEGVLKYSKLGSSAQVFEPVDLKMIIEQVQVDLELLIQSKNAEIIQSGLTTIKASSILMYQLFYNILLNSLKFSKEGVAPLIKISATTKLEGQKGNLEITVTDNGIGFDPEFEKLVFNTFTRLNPSEEFEGTGLGLALCKKIVERHHGSIMARSKENEGATFIITLPINVQAK